MVLSLMAGWDDDDEIFFDDEESDEHLVKKLDSSAIIAELEAGGAIAKRLPQYENRASQLDLMRLVIQGFNEDALVAAEAGTGVGKSFAYLLPAVSFALLNDERIAISTATITLQQQLFEKDIPLVLSALGAKIKTVLIKGRGNFLCRRRLLDALAQSGESGVLIDEGENEQIQQIADWAQTAKTGSKSELPFMAKEGVWANVCSESDTCLGQRCPMKETCFVMEIRRQAAEARILVVNHHLLFADLATRAESAGYEGTVVLPPYRRIIIDEAHTIENSATSFFSESWSKLSLYRHIARLYRRRGAAKRGLLLRLQAFSSGPDNSDEWGEQIDLIRDAAQQLDEAALELCGKESFRFIPERAPLIEERLLPLLSTLSEDILSWTQTISALVEEVEQKEEEKNGGRKDAAAAENAMLLREVSSCRKRLAAIAHCSKNFIAFREHPEEVFWIERRASRGSGRNYEDWALFTKAPIDISPKLTEALFEPNKTVVCLSATLTVAERFTYWESRVGIKLARESFSSEGDAAMRKVLQGRFPSPFPYSRAVLLAIPTDAPLPEDKSFRAFVNEGVLRLASLSGGAALILFTSFESLNSAYHYAKERLYEQGIRCFKQGDDDRSRLLRAFLDDQKSVLFATDSFWEGVDAPGDTLKLVIICRLPFKAPNDPVFEARCEAVLRRGANPFMELSVPEAVMKFRQGFGRLIRRASDSGVVAVLDGRILKKRYGEVFLRSLPKTKTSFTDFDTLCLSAFDIVLPTLNLRI
ncbi:MAG: ATP-dependent DNA helicase DinG [Spirochaetaceae bacterium]|nr:ATP-dependent DNA helicase DinG [Spirochaetaceae bacterium]